MSIEAGNILRETREEKGVSIKEASDTLHIRIPYLQALENGRAEIIPSAVQARGFLRIYAEYLNLSAADIIQEWDNPGSTSLSNKNSPSDGHTAPVSPPPVPPVSGNPSYVPNPYTPVSPTQSEAPAAPPFQAAAESLTPIPPVSGNSSYSPNPYTPVSYTPAEAHSSQPVPNVSIQQTISQPEITVNGQEKQERTEKEKESKEPKPKRSLFRKKTSEAPKTKDPETAAQELFDDIGSQLSYRRKMLALSLEDCESQTLIRSIYIESMENGKFEQLPSFIQARGMLNNYASFLDLDVDAIMLKLAEAIQLLSQKKNNRTDNRKRKPTKTAGKARKFFTPDLFVGVFVIVGIAGIIIYSAVTIAAYRRNVAEPTPNLGISLLDQFLDTTRTPEFLPTASPTATAVVQNPNAEFILNEPTEESQEPESLQPVHIFVTANQRALMTVISDGKEVFSGRTIPNNTYPFDAENLIELSTGNANALSVVYNQQNMGRLGKIGEILTIDFSPLMAATPTPLFSPTPTNTYEPTYTPQPETPLPTNTPTPYIP